MNAEGTYPVILKTTEVPARATTALGDAAKPAELEFPRRAMRIVDQSAGSEALLGDTTVEIGGALAWIVRSDDLLDGYDVDVTDPANPVRSTRKVRPRIHAGWRLTDVTTGIEYEIVSVTEMRMPDSNELRYRLHTKNSVMPDGA